MRLMRLPEIHFGRNVMRCSGGERQRVALARAFAYDPEILFFDEPLSALDYKLKKTLEKELKDIHKESGKTFIYITHSLEEAMVMSDRIAVMNDGRIVQVGTPEEIYTRPVNRFVAEFMGEVNILAGPPPAPTGSTRATSCRAASGWRARRPRRASSSYGRSSCASSTGAGRGRERHRGRALQLLLARLAPAVPGAGGRQGRSCSNSPARRAGAGASTPAVLVGWDSRDGLFVEG